MILLALDMVSFEMEKCDFYHATNGYWFTMSHLHKNQLVQSKRLLVKTNQIHLWLIVYQKLYGYQLTISHCEELASPKQTAIGKDTSNPLIAGSLLKTMQEQSIFNYFYVSTAL